jgi:phosphoribosylformylglycinamidine synthase I
MMTVTTHQQPLTIGIARFFGSNCDQDCAEAVGNVMHAKVVFLWQDDEDQQPLETTVDAVIIPGGFSYGDYLRCGAMANQSPLMQRIKTYANKGFPVLGICNGFQILTESGLLPGALIPNQHQQFTCQQHTQLVVAQAKAPFTSEFKPNQWVDFPIAHGDGCYTADENTLAQLEANGQVVFRYKEGTAVNGSVNGIAGICNEAGNVLGLMPHPERNWWTNPAVERTGYGRLVFDSLTKASLASKLTVLTAK